MIDDGEFGIFVDYMVIGDNIFVFGDEEIGFLGYVILLWRLWWCVVFIVIVVVVEVMEKVFEWMIIW